MDGLIGIKLDKGRCWICVELHADLTIKPIKHQIHSCMHNITNKRAHKMIILLYIVSKQNNDVHRKSEKGTNQFIQYISPFLSVNEFKVRAGFFFGNLLNNNLNLFFDCRQYINPVLGKSAYIECNKLND